MKKRYKVLIGVGITLLLIAIGSFFVFQRNTYSATPEAEKISQSAKDEKDYLYLDSGKKDATLVIFYPGALVAPESYSLWADNLATRGYDVAIIKMPLDLAVLAPNRAETVLEDHPNQEYVIGGHSLGGVMGSRYVANHFQEDQRLRGMFYLASYPDEKGSLKNTNLAVLSITATNDQVLNQEAYKEAKQYLPKQTVYESIDGGNHAGFGSYGAQRGDGKATISTEKQQEEVANRLVDWLQTIEQSTKKETK